jgi:uncharacterized protein DUF3987/Toprim domain-containing protein
VSPPVEKLITRLRAKRSAKGWRARCPAHDDREPSLSIDEGADGRALVKCWAGCTLDAVLLALGLTKKDLFPLSPLSQSSGSGRPEGSTLTATRFDWQKCVDAFTDNHVEQVAKWRGFSPELVRELRDAGLIGVFNGLVAFQMRDRAGNVISAHYRLKDSSWGYYPQGAKVRPLVIGELAPGDTVHVFESYWDALAFIDASGERSGIIVTRGASNGTLLADVIPQNAKVYLWPQNDAAGDKWTRDIFAHTKATVKDVKVAAPYKDLNDWRRAGATSDDLLAAMKTAGNSLNSQFFSFALREDYPKPLAREAFYGLPGEIVRRIEPHTEADPAALLFQFLTAFGNLIGHDHYIVADGTRHHLNLHGVLVGQSSKGRKGTSWNHIANVMERVEPEWRQDRISVGLSSGEGLIWAVHDPIEETRPIREKGRCTGEYETFIANHGEDDKRLLVIEAEFANVLKVMAREGNTLSPIIRSAWDCGDLKTMVKNSPAKATKAHISILGHITREELRRLLIQTESANGFANRFCWLAVKRSKCLPDGGAIHTVNFDDVVAKLQSAINFAKDFVEIVRDPEAKKRWHDVYPRLSEPQPGLSGAVIGRAEAQVMRLSAIYALVDKSNLIRPEHHQAAMALWRYCEQSARWVFGTSTGNKNADKILVALRHAPNGMTKTEISAEVFNRHASSADIDEALRLLHGQGVVDYRNEASGGAPIQRWFFVRETSEKSE